MVRNSAVSCCVCAEYVNLEFWCITFLFMNYQDSTKKKKCHFVSLSFCVIFEIQCHFRRYIIININIYYYIEHFSLSKTKMTQNDNDTK